LCVSDMPFKGAVKLPGSSEDFYRKRVAQHIRIGIATCQYLSDNPQGLHSRKLRGFFETAFR
ncbi:MAG: AMP nucleosidase, partial [Alphaproteobacteria bacterium]|nr:AMP nucleosidase [Alphaproteobacteria bacterium]